MHLRENRMFGLGDSLASLTFLSCFVRAGRRFGSLFGGNGHGPTENRGNRADRLTVRMKSFE